MNILFCEDPFDYKTVDPDFEDEFLAAKANEFTIHLFSFEQLTREGNISLAIKQIRPATDKQTIIYRGWMLKPKQYTLLYEGLLAKNYQLINSPAEYQNCHYLPDSYKFIESRTPASVWMKIDNGRVDYARVFKNIEIFGDSPLIVKDFVKSQKHYWDTACFIPSASDHEKVKSVIDRFVQLQGTDLNEGLVIRKFVELHELSNHSKSGMPLKQEYRLFFFKGKLVGCYDYWEEGDYAAGEELSLASFETLAQTIQSHFFSMDIAKTKSDEWVVIELGDAQVARLPDKVQRDEFYTHLKRINL